MSYGRFVSRNQLHGDYENADPLGSIKGDLRRMERDQQDETHVADYVRFSGATEEQVRFILKCAYGYGPTGTLAPPKAAPQEPKHESWCSTLQECDCGAAITGKDKP
jgi:hypothetical protein